MKLPIKIKLTQTKAGAPMLLVECRSHVLSYLLPAKTAHKPEKSLEVAIERFLYYFNIFEKAKFFQEDKGLKFRQWTYQVETESYPSRPFFVSEKQNDSLPAFPRKCRTIAMTRTQKEAQEIRNLDPIRRKVVRRMTEDFNFLNA